MARPWPGVLSEVLTHRGIETHRQVERGARLVELAAHSAQEIDLGRHIVIIGLLASCFHGVTYKNVVPV